MIKKQYVRVGIMSVAILVLARCGFHIQGSQEQLDPLARQLLGTRLDVIKAAF